tara:strand:+ start:568 stop:801 length:234 start_codon:yes stop_codon:yes gene_type:complete
MKKKNKSKDKRTQNRNRKRSISEKNRRKKYAKVKLGRKAERVKENRAKRELAAMEREVEKIQNKATQIRNNPNEKAK